MSRGLQRKACQPKFVRTYREGVPASTGVSLSVVAFTVGISACCSCRGHQTVKVVMSRLLLVQWVLCTVVYSDWANIIFDNGLLLAHDE